jgi:serine/threonine protein kinase
MHGHMSAEFEGGRYRLQERLSPDGNSWMAEDLEEPGQRVVVKVLPDTADAIAARHLVESLADLRGSALSVPVDEGEMPDGRPFLVYRFAEGQSLRELLNTAGPLPFGRAAAILKQLGEAVHRLHERSMIHGSIAPEHIVVSHNHGRDSVTLLGAGVFRATRESTASPAYLAPEQLAGNPTALSDVFSLAAVAAEVLTGRRAFRYGSLDELHHLHKRGIQRGAFRKLRPKLPLRVEDELRRGLAWDPGQRPPDAHVLTQRLAEFLGVNRGLPRRRLALLGVLGLAVIATGVRNCRRRWGYSSRWTVPGEKAGRQTAMYSAPSSSGVE